LPGTNIRARNYAHKNGWHGPLAWDDIDDPNCKPESERNRRKPGARKKSAVDPARVAELTDLGHSAAEIAFQLGCHVRTVTRARGRVLTEVAA
jgi:DNA invertase Pin-like site-specific DNA recombinase